MDHLTTDGVRLSCLADAANFSTDGKLNIHGEFNTIASDSPVASWPRMFYVAKVEVSALEVGRREFELRIIGPDGQIVMPPQRGAADVGSASHGDSRFIAIILEIRGLTFSGFGTYSVELWRTDEGPSLMDSFGLYFRQAQG